MKTIKVYATVETGVSFDLLVSDEVADNIEKCYDIANSKIESDMDYKGIKDFEIVNLDIIK